MSSSNCWFLTCIQISHKADQVVWYSHLLKNFPQVVVIYTVKGIGIVNKAEIDVFLELPCFFDDPADVGNLISGSSAFSKTSLNTCKFMIHVLLKPGLENLKHYFTSVWDKCNCAVVWAFFGITFLWDWNENWPFPVLWPGKLLGWVFQIFWHVECSTCTASSFRIWNSSTGIPSPPLAFLVVMLPKTHLTLHSRMSGSRWMIVHYRASLVAQVIKSLPALRETWVLFLVWENPLEKKWQPTPVFWPGKTHGWSTWGAIVHCVTKSQTQLSDSHTQTHTHMLI